MASKPIRHRINEQIRGVKEVRLIDTEGKMIGVYPFREALNTAWAHDLDLIEVRPGNPPVCKILDYGKYKYETIKAAKEAKKSQHHTEVKEVVLRPVTDTHDLLVKARHVREWLDEGNKVKITVKLKGRERVHPEQGVGIIQSLLDQVGGHKVESPARSEGKVIVAMIAP